MSDDSRGDYSDLPFDPDSADTDTGGITGTVRPLHLQASALALVFGGGVLGTLARYGVENALPHRSPDWPLATFGINIVGAFVLGLLLESLVRRGPDTGVRRRARLLCGTGFCGAFTTYSTFALETVNLGQDGHLPTALAYAVSTVVLGAAAAWGGIVLGARRNR